VGRPIERLLIANRGEIALRIQRTARKMGIRTVAIYSDADCDALHVTDADMAIRIGPPPARDSYLDISAVLDAARVSAADAVHPGYGFLSENAAFAEACEQAGLNFVGPAASSIALMGDKARARMLARSAGVPMLQGYDDEEQSAGRLAAEAAAIGFPVLLKPAAGGGGKGMKIVRSSKELAEAALSARREAESAFGDGRLIVEKFIEQPRHVEVQIFADKYGNIVHLFDRDCSVQRRHQKVIEEAPAAGLPDGMRQAMRKAALTLAASCNYVGAGTLEFLVSGENFYFMEMNTRLQVEHTVTEAITGIDLVEWQLRIASGETMPLSQDQIAASGHAVEARLCAEDPEAGFLPQSGLISHLRFPSGLEGLRVDTAVRPGSFVPVQYDSLIAKLITHGKSREEAIQNLLWALEETQVVGVATNRRLLSNILRHSAFRTGNANTGFIAENAGNLLDAEAEPGHVVIAMAAFAGLLQEIGKSAGRDPFDPWSPWALMDGWCLGGVAVIERQLAYRGKVHSVAIGFGKTSHHISVDGEPVEFFGQLYDDGRLDVVAGNCRLKATAVFDAGVITLFHDGRDYRFDAVRDDEVAQGQGAAGHLRSPMPGTVISVAVKAGDKVSKGSPLAVVEAMKMEHTISAPFEGIVASVLVNPGDQVAAGIEVAVMELPS
jgi:3-methylcrotonyl-CoA carboxylase alpha subunit